MDLQTVITDYIKNEVMRNRNASLNEDEDLFLAGILDSLELVRLVAFIQETFGIKIPNEDVIFSNFSSIKALAAYLKSY